MSFRSRLPSTRSEAISTYDALFAAAEAQDQADQLAIAQALALGQDAPPATNAALRLKRWLCRNDLFFLLVFALRRKDINHDWLFARCREVERAPNGFLDLWAREHYKSTIITFGLSIQDILASHGEEPEPRYNGREVTIGILSFNRPTAKAFLRQIKQEFELNTDLQATFPDILYSGSSGEIQRQAVKWSEDDGIVVRRKTNPKEATVEAHGLVDGTPTGKHYLIINYDDVVTRESVTTPEMMLKTTAAWELSTNLGTEGGWARYIGTRYNLFDTYATMMDRGIPARVHACTSDGSEDWSKAVLRSPEFLADRRAKQGPYTFGAQMLLNPTADKAQGFRREWLRYWPNGNVVGLNLYMIVDPASKKKKSSDYTTMWVIGIGPDEKYRVVDVVRDRLNLTERQKTLFRLHRKYRPLAVGYEEYGLQADIEHHKYVMTLENYDFTITPLGGTVAKEDRIKALVPVFESGRMLLPENGIVYLDYQGQAVDLIATFIREEYEAFPAVSHDDMLDAMARILEPALGVTAAPPAPLEPEYPKWMQDLITESGIKSWETQ